MRLQWLAPSDISMGFRNLLANRRGCAGVAMIQHEAYGLRHSCARFSCSTSIVLNLPFDSVGFGKFRSCLVDLMGGGGWETEPSGFANF